MKTGKYKGYETALSEPGILWIRFNRPERKNGMTSSMKRELIETLTQAQMENMMNSMNKHGVKMLTAEAPVEYTVEGIVQQELNE